MKGIFKTLSYAFHGSCTDIKTCFSRIFFPKCNKPIVKWYKPHGAIHVFCINSYEFFKVKGLRINEFLMWAVLIYKPNCKKNYESPQ